MATRQQGTVLWEPSDELRERATITRYMRWLESERDLRFEDYDALWRWSTEELEAFWASIWEFFEVQGSYDEVLADASMPGAKWFTGAELSYPEHIFRDRAGDRVAIRHASELREPGEWTWDELREQTARVAAGLRAMGIERGDRIVAYMPNIPETIAAFLAAASLGAVWSSCSPDFGARSVVDRFAQIEPKVLLTVDGYRYGGKDFDRGELIERVQGEMPSLERTVTLAYLGDEGDWDEAFPPTDEPLEFARVPFDHPLWVLYSSGTTGLPKAIVHSQGGILVEHLKKHNLHLDAQEGDRIFWFTTTGWMMWNFLVSVLLTEASIVLYDGNPGTPDMDVLWGLAEETGMTCFGTSAAYLASCMKAEVEPANGRDLSALRSVGSTGSPLAPEGFEWVYEHVGEKTWLFSTSGGTDMCTAFVGGVPILPVYRGEMQCRALGARVEAYDEDGNAVTDEVGELVITAPMPSMPIYFWDDEDGEKLRESYFEMYPGGLAPRRLDPHHRARHRRHHRPLGLDDQPRRHPHGHRGDLPRRARARRDHRRAGRRHRAGRRRLDAAVRRAARGRRARRRPREGDRQARPRGLLAAPRPERGVRGEGGAAHALGQGARGAGQEDPHRHSGREGGEPRLAREPGVARLLRRARRRARGVTERASTRRRFLAASAGTVGVLAFGPAFWRSALAPGAVVAGPSPYGELQGPDAQGLRLPPGFRSRIVARANQPVAGTAYPWHVFPDGGATFPLDGGGWALASNSESLAASGAGTSAIRFRSDGAIADAYRILGGTNANCAGGPTPWGAWLSCEEYDGGHVWECDPTRAGQGTIRPALGTFNHEAACVDPVARRLYMTEDKPDGALYRFTPDRYPDLTEGRLEVAVAASAGRVGWRELPDPSAITGATRDQVAGTRRFNGGEGIWFDSGHVYFSTKGDNRVWDLHAESGRLEVLYDAAAVGAGAPLRGVDNLTVTRAGELFVCEDGGNMEICVITADRTVAPFLQLVGAAAQGPLDRGNELAGVAFNPAGDRMYFSAQRAFDFGVTYEVRGPFAGAGAPGSARRSRARAERRGIAPEAARRRGAGDLGRPAAQAGLRGRDLGPRRRQRRRGVAHGRARTRPGPARLGRQAAARDAGEGAQAPRPGPRPCCASRPARGPPPGCARGASTRARLTVQVRDGDGRVHVLTRSVKVVRRRRAARDR